MNSIIDEIFLKNKYYKSTYLEIADTFFYYLNPEDGSNYFIIKSIDATKIISDAEKMNLKLKELEENYINSYIKKDKSIKNLIKELPEIKDNISALDKNMSAIYLVKINDMTELASCRNLIYSIEESTDYFKRYIIPYTKQQENDLKKIIEENPSEDIVTILNDLSDDSDEYYELMKNQYYSGVYNLVIKLFSKIPFLQYRFKATDTKRTLEENLTERLTKEHLISYIEPIKNVLDETDDDMLLKAFLDLSEAVCTDQEVEKYILERGE